MSKIVIEGEIGWDITASDVVNKLKDMTGDITVEVSSVGGSVYQGISIFNALHEYDKGTITTVNKGMAASMASYIMLAGDKIKAYSNATYMVHNAMVFAFGNASELRKSADHVESLSNIMANMYADKTGKTVKEVKQMMDEETFLYGEEMLQHGFVDEIIYVEKDLGRDTAKANLLGEVASCLSSSKEHCKEEGYTGDIGSVLNSLAAMPSYEKIVNQTDGESMETVPKEKFDAIVAKHDELVASNGQLTESLSEMTSKMETLEAQANDRNLEEVIAFCGANREPISFSKEAEFVKAGATLQEVMDYAMSQEENAPSGNLNFGGNDETAADDYIKAAIAKQNKGEL